MFYVQLTGAELIPFSTEKATIFQEAVYIALGNRTIYAVNVSSYTLATSVPHTRCHIPNLCY